MCYFEKMDLPGMLDQKDLSDFFVKENSFSEKLNAESLLNLNPHTCGLDIEEKISIFGEDWQTSSSTHFNLKETSVFKKIDSFQFENVFRNFVAFLFISRATNRNQTGSQQNNAQNLAQQSTNRSSNPLPSQNQQIGGSSNGDENGEPKKSGELGVPSHYLERYLSLFRGQTLYLINDEVHKWLFSPEVFPQLAFGCQSETNGKAFSLFRIKLSERVGIRPCPVVVFRRNNVNGSLLNNKDNDPFFGNPLPFILVTNENEKQIYCDMLDQKRVFAGPSISAEDKRYANNPILPVSGVVENPLSSKKAKKGRETKTLPPNPELSPALPWGFQGFNLIASAGVGYLLGERVNRLINEKPLGKNPSVLSIQREEENFDRAQQITLLGSALLLQIIETVFGVAKSQKEGSRKKKDKQK